MAQLAQSARLRDGIDPCMVVGAVAMADAEMLCNACADKEEVGGKLRAAHAMGHACGRCGLLFDEAERLEPSDLPEVAARLAMGSTVLSTRFSVGPLRFADGSAVLGIIGEPHGRTLYSDLAGDTFEAARLFLALCIARQVGYKEAELCVVSALDLRAGDQVFELAVYEAYEVQTPTVGSKSVHVSVKWEDRGRSYSHDHMLVVTRREEQTEPTPAEPVC